MGILGIRVGPETSFTRLSLEPLGARVPAVTVTSRGSDSDWQIDVSASTRNADRRGRSAEADLRFDWRNLNHEHGRTKGCGSLPFFLRAVLIWLPNGGPGSPSDDINSKELEVEDSQT